MDTVKGGTMRLGSYPCRIEEGTLAFDAYNKKLIYERHRHRYEFNNAYLEQLEKVGLRYSGTSPDKGLVEIVELKDHPWFLGCQFHPEFKFQADGSPPALQGVHQGLPQVWSGFEIEGKEDKEKQKCGGKRGQKKGD